MTDNSDMEVYHRTRKEHQSGSRAASLLFGFLSLGSFIFGLILLNPITFVIWAGLGIIFLAVALLVDARYQIIDYCDACGNTISATTHVCPHCQAKIITPPLSWWQKTNVVLGIILVLIFIGLSAAALFI